VFTIPNDADTATPGADSPDSRDFDVLAQGYQLTGVESEDGATSGQVTTSSGLTLNVAQANVRIAGRRVFMTGGTVTLGAAHASLGRWDLVSSDTAGTRTVIPGTAAANPVFPTFSQSTRVILAAVYVGPTVTTINSTEIIDKRVMVWRPEFENIRWYGADPAASGTTNQTAIHAALAMGNSVVPPFEFTTRKITMPHGRVLVGVNSGTYNNTFASGLVSILKLEASQNTDVIEIPITANRGKIADLQIDGNKANQSSGSGCGINFLADSAQNEAQWTISHVYTHDNRGSGIKVDGWRQAVELYRCISNSNSEHGIQVIGTDCAVLFPICGENASGAGVVISANVTTLLGGSIYNNQRGVEITSGIKRVTVAEVSIDKNLRQGVIIASTCDAISLIANKFTSNGRETDNTYGHVDIQTTTGGVTLVANQWSGLEPGVTNDASWGVAQVASGAFFDAGNIFPTAASQQGFSQLPELVYTSTRPTFQGALSLFHSDLTGATAIAEQGLNLPSALTEFDVTFAGTRRTLEAKDLGREFQISVRFREVAHAGGSNSYIFSIRDTSNTANILCTVTQAASGPANFESISSWTTRPSWLTGSKTLALYTSGGDGADDIIVRDATLRWRG
jgi:hypothetical protein